MLRVYAVVTLLGRPGAFFAHFSHIHLASLSFFLPLSFYALLSSVPLARG